MGLQSWLRLRGAPTVGQSNPRGTGKLGFLPADTPERERERERERKEVKQRDVEMETNE